MSALEPSFFDFDTQSIFEAPACKDWPEKACTLSVSSPSKRESILVPSDYEPSLQVSFVPQATKMNDVEKIDGNLTFRATLGQFNSFHFTNVGTFGVLRAPGFFTFTAQSVIDLHSPKRVGVKRRRRRQKTCNCKNSSCLKLYCDCFKEGGTCGSSCRCKDCKNQQGNQLREQALLLKGISKHLKKT